MENKSPAQVEKKGQTLGEIIQQSRAEHATHLYLRVEFSHSPDVWQGRCSTFIGDTPVSLGFISNAPKRPAKTTENRDQQRKARNNLTARKYPGFAKRIEGFKSDRDFECWFIKRVQDWILDRAAQGQVLVPLNCAEEILTPAFIMRWATRLTRKRSRRKVFDEFLNSVLIENWKHRREKNFCEMDRYTLYEQVKHIGVTFAQKLTPKMVWQRAYRLGLFTERNPGPVERE